MRKLNAAQPIVFPNGTMQPLFRDFLLSLENGLSVSWDQVTGTPTTLEGYGIVGGNLTGDFSVGSTVFFVDESAGRAGINQGSPAVPLHVTQSGVTALFSGAYATARFEGGSPGLTIAFDGSNFGGINWATPSHANDANIVVRASDRDMRFAVGGNVERLRIESSGGSARPGADGTQNLGTASFRWSTVYATTGTINTSDSRLKRNVAPLPVAAAYTLLGGSQPVRYRWKPVTNIDGEGQEAIHEDDKYYLGYIAQNVGQAIQSLGINPLDYAMFHHDPESDRYGMRYTEMIAPIHTVVNDHTARIEALENALAAAMSRIAALEALP